MMWKSALLSAAEHKSLPNLLKVRTNKDKLYNDIIAFLEKNYIWVSKGNEHGSPFIDGQRHALKEQAAQYQLCSQGFQATTNPKFQSTGRDLQSTWRQVPLNNMLVH